MPLVAKKQLNLDFVKTHKLLYGLPGTGKSTIASLMGDDTGRTPLFLATEDGHNSLSVSAVRLTDGWESLLRFADWIETNKEQLVNEHSCIVVDLVSDLDSWCGTWVAKQKKVEYVGDLDQGKGWKILREKFQEPMSRLMALRPCVFVAHSQEKRVQWNAEQIVTQAPSLGKGSLEYVNGKVDTIMYIVPANSKKEFPAISMRPNLAYIAKSHQRALCREFPFDPANPKPAYDEICSIYATAQAAEAQKQAPQAAPQGDAQ